MTKRQYRRQQLLKLTGEQLYGPRWKTQLATALDLTAMTVWNYATAETPVPEKVAQQCLNLLHDRQILIGATIATYQDVGA